MVLVGWVPKSFVSSRSQRSDASTQQKPEDFMDEEVAVVTCNQLTFGTLLSNSVYTTSEQLSVHLLLGMAQ